MPVLVISVIVVVILCIKLKTTRQRISLLAGLGISVLSFFCFIVFAFFAQQTLLWLLLGIFYAAAIVFLVLWNIIKSKKIYFLLCVPFICVVSGAGIIAYQDYVEKIPTVTESGVFLYEYKPFAEHNRLAVLDEKPRLKITGNVPVIDGATALYPVYAAFAQAVYPEGEYDPHVGPAVFCSKTGGAYQNLLEGKADIIFCAEASGAQLQRFKERNIKLKFVPIGKEAFVFFVNKNNPVNNISAENIRGIYSGKIKNWKEINGPDKNIMAFQRPENSGSQTMLEKIMGNTPIQTPRRENVPGGMGGIINEVAVYRNFSNAVGFSFLQFCTEMVKNDQIKLLSVNGVYPSRETIPGGEYPFSENFYAVFVDSEKKNENTELFVEWILSDQGRELIQKTGYVPVGSTP